MTFIYSENEVEYLKPNSQPNANKAADYVDDEAEGEMDGKKEEGDMEGEEEEKEKKKDLKRVGIPIAIAKIVFFREQDTGNLRGRGWEVPTSGKKTTAKSCEVKEVQTLAQKAKLDIKFDMENEEILPRDQAFYDLTHRACKVRIPPKKVNEN